MELQGREIRTRGKLIEIAFLDGEGYQFLEDPDAGVETLRKLRHRFDLFTFVQNLSDTTPRFAYPMEWDNLAALEVTTFDNWMKHQIDFKARNKARKSAKAGIAVREAAFDDDFVRGISEIYNESPIRQGKPFWHYHKAIDAVRRMNATFMDRSIFIGAFSNGSLIGFVKMVASEDWKQAGLMQIVSMIRHRDKAPTNALIAQAVKTCAERGIAHLWYANFSYGKKQEDSLAEFKRHNGFKKVDVPRYYVPLTVAGRVALRLGVHRQAADWIPEPLTSTYRKVRRIWYAKRFPGFENA